MGRALGANQRLRLAAACAAIVYIALFWRLGDSTFWDPDEAHYAETSREMIESGDWLAPMYNGQPFFDKPIFFHWFQGGAMALAGATEGPARFPGAVAGALLVALTAWIGSRFDGPKVGALAALLLAVNPGLFGLARYAILDAPFTLWLFGGVCCLAVAALQGRPRLQWLGYLAIATAVCIKGPVALVLCGVALLVASLASPEVRRKLFALQWIRGLALIVGLSAPWFAYMLVRFGGAFVNGYVLNENVKLFAAPLYANQPGWWFYLQILAVGFLPWTPLILGRAWDQARGRWRKRPHADPFDVMLWSWVVGVLVFFSASAFKLDHYIFPVAPALCLLTARAWFEERDDAAHMAGRRFGARSVGPLLAIAGAAVAYLALTRLTLPATFLAVPLGILALGLLSIWQRRTGSTLFPWASIGALTLLYIGVVAFVLPALERGKVIPDLARWVQGVAAPEHRVGTFRLNRWNPAFRFYVSRDVTMIDSEEDARTFFAEPTPFLLVTTQERFEALKREGAPLEIVYSREGVWATSGRLLWRARGQPTTFVVARKSAD